MPKYAEVIFEDGSKSVMSYEDENGEDLKSALLEHHTRAKEGRPGAPQDQQVRGDIDYSVPGYVHPDTAKQRPAVRVYRVLLYSDHPSDLHPEGVDVEALKELVQGMEREGTVDPEQLIRALRDEVSPVYPVNQGNRESIYKAEGEELDVGFLEGGEE